MYIVYKALCCKCRALTCKITEEQSQFWELLTSYRADLMILKYCMLIYFICPSGKNTTSTSGKERPVQNRAEIAFYTVEASCSNWTKPFPRQSRVEES